MKKLLFLVCAVFALASCSDKNKSDEPKLPIEGLEMPSATTPIVAGAPVTIKGSGFTAASEIWLNAITKAGEGVKATVTAFTATSISFIAPDSISGEQNITLRQDGKEFSLGKLTFEMAKVDVAKEGLYCFYDVYEDTSSMVRHVDLSTGVVTEVVKSKECGGYNGAVAIGKTLYMCSRSYDQYSKLYLYSFDLTSKTEKALKTNSKLDNVDLLVIDNKLNAAYFDSETRIASLYDVNTTNGELTKIADCDMSILPFINEGQAQVYSTVYSAKENCIVMVAKVYLDGGRSEYYYFVSIDLASKKITNHDFLQADDGRYRYSYSLFNKGTEIGVVKGITSGDNNDDYSTEIYTIDAKTLKLGATKLGSCDYWLGDCGYDVKTDILYCSSGNGAYALDLKTGAGSKVPNTETTKEEDEDGIRFSGIFFLQ